MDTEGFFSKVLPAQGIVALAEPQYKPGQNLPYWRHFKYATRTEAAAAAAAFDTAGRTIYQACSTFKEVLPTKFRTQGNAGHQKSFWVDADVEAGNPAKYANQKEALQDVVRVCKELCLPIPTIVDSGGGLHLYWTLDQDITTAEWTPVAQKLKATLTAHGFKQDPSRTADAASVLRPVGTHNRKREPARLVRCLNEGKDTPLERFAAAIGANVVAPIMPTMASDENDDLGGGIEYPPSSADRIIKFCPTLKHVADTQGNVPEPLWHKSIGVCKHTAEGVQRCHEWSVGHPDYSEYETQQKIDNWATGPATCASFRQVTENKCEGCTQTCKSPIQLGYSGEAEAPEAFIASGGFTTTPLVVTPKRFWPKGYKVENGLLCRAVKDNKQEDAPYSWVPFCKSMFFPVERVRDENGVWSLHIEMLTYRKERRRFLIPTQYLVEPQSLVSELAKNEVIIFGRNGKEYAMDFVGSFLESLNMDSPEILTYGSFGWTDDGRGFILGSEKITATSSEAVLCSENITKLGLDVGFGVSGSRDEWVELVNKIYNRKGAEAYQFLFCVALASPLIPIAGINSFHGIPVALTGIGGLGKSTTCKVACSAFGDMESMYVDGSPEGGSMLPLQLRASIFRNVPLVYDEMTQRTVQELTGMLYGLSNGRGRTRLTPQGNVAAALSPWDMFSFITGNKDITALLATQDRSTAGATEMRCFEIQLPDNYNEKLFGDTDVRTLVDTKIQNCYGHVGREYLRYIMKHREKVTEMIFKVRAQFRPQDGDQTRERFYMDTIVLACVAGTIANRLGILQFDMKALMRWSLNHVKSLRITRRAVHSTDEEYVAGMLASLHGRTLVTSSLPETRGGRYTPEAPLEHLRDLVVARNVTKERRFFLSAKYTNDWSRDFGVSHRTLIDTMDKMGLIRHHSKSDAQGMVFFNLAQGSTLSSAKTRCLELNYDVLVGMDAEVEKEPKKVVPIRNAS